MSSSKTPSAGMQFIKALLRVVIAAAIFFGVYYAYARHTETSLEVKKLSQAAYDLLQNDLHQEYIEAADNLRKALELRPKDEYALAALAETETLLWLEHGYADREQQARAATDAANNADLNLAERFSAAALVQIADGQLDQAERELIELTETGTSTARIVAAIGLVHLRKGKLETARNDFKQASDREWRNPRFTVMYADSYFDSGDFLTAQGTYEKALAMNSHHLGAVVGKARADIARSERISDAVRTLDDLIGREDETSPLVRSRALTGKAEALLAQKSFEEAEAAANEAIENGSKIDPHYAYAHFALGRALAALGKDGASEAFEAAISHNPAIDRFYFDAAVALAKAEKPEAGEELFARFKEFHKDDKTRDSFHLAYSAFFHAQGDLEAAHKELDEALALNEVNSETYYRKGALFQEQAEAARARAEKTRLYDEARQQYEKAVRIRERFPEVYAQMGLIYLDLNPRSQQALQNLVEALNIYKEQKAPRHVMEDLITTVEQRYIKARLPHNATAWRREATELAR